MRPDRSEGFDQAEPGGIHAAANVTAQRPAGQVSEESDANFRVFFETIEDMVFVGSPDGRILFSNHAASRKLGFTPEELRAMLLIDLHPAELRREAEEIVGAMLRGERETCPLPLEKKSGGRLLVETRVWLGKWDGKDCLFGLCKDSTDLSRTARLLQESEERFRRMADAAPVLLWESGTDGLCNYFNKPWLDFTGRTLEQESENGWTEGVHPEDFQSCQETYLEAFGAWREFKMEYRLRRADGEYRWLLDHGVPRFTPDGSFLGFIGSCVDITERKQKDEELRRLAERLSLATKAGGVGIWDYDVVKNQLVWDDQMYRLYGITRGQFGGAYEAWTAGLHPEDRARGDLEIQNALRGEKEFDTEFRVLWPSGTIHHIRAMALVQRDAAGQPLHMIGTNWDITGQKRSQEVALQNVGRTEELNRLKARFVSMASHEIRVDCSRQDILTLTVLDSGIGVPEAERKFLFDAFSRASNVGGAPGSGLGLFIAQKCAQAHGGHLSYLPQKNGSLFFLTIPLPSNVD